MLVMAPDFCSGGTPGDTIINTGGTIKTIYLLQSQTMLCREKYVIAKGCTDYFTQCNTPRHALTHTDKQTDGLTHTHPKCSAPSLNTEPKQPATAPHVFSLPPPPAPVLSCTAPRRARAGQATCSLLILPSQRPLSHTSHTKASQPAASSSPSPC